MEEKNLGIVQAIDIAMEAEKKANEFYSDALASVSGEKGKNLLQQLANFEQAHYDALAALKESLKSEGKFISYSGTKFTPFKASSEISGTEELDKEDVSEILVKAIEAENKAFELYRKLADETSDQQGADMFSKLAEEEVMHRRILSDEFYYRNNSGGVWFWGD